MDLTSNVTHNFSAQAHSRSLMSMYLHEPKGVKAFRLVMEALIALCGVFGNILVCLVITRCFRIKTPTHFYILNLAVADLGILLVNFPFAVLREQSPTYWPLGEGVCLYFYPLSEVFYGVSIWSIAAIAIERYRTIASVASASIRQLSLYRESARKTVYRTLASIWVVSFLVVSLPTFFLITYSETLSVCNVKTASFALEQAYNLSLVIFWYLLPLAIITWTYVRIERSLRESTKFHKRMSKNVEMSSLCSSDEPTRLCNVSRVKQNARVRRILTPVLAIFAVTMLPVNVFRLVLTYWKGILFLNSFFVLYNVCIVLVVINSASNVFIYSLVSKEFRHGFKMLLSRRK